MKWTPVTKKLPEVPEYYLVTAENNEGYRWLEHCLWDRQEGFLTTGDFVNITKQVIAWMPEPEPYGGKK